MARLENTRLISASSLPPGFRTTFPTKVDYNSHEAAGAPGRRKVTASCLVKSRVADDRKLSMGFWG